MSWNKFDLIYYYWEGIYKSSFLPPPPPPPPLQVAILHGKIGELRRDVSSQKRLTNSVIQHRVKIQLELVETREEFQTFIDVVRPFNESESKYILPPIKSFTDADMADGLL